MMSKRLHRHAGDSPAENRRRQPLIFVFLMAIGILTILYLFIVYILMPLLALMTIS